MVAVRMVSRPAKPIPRVLAQLSGLMKALRRRRGLRVSETAAAVGMPRRSYQHFEAGRGRLDVGRLHRFAQAIDADFYALLAALEIGSPAFALRCADNKLMTIFMMALQDFDALAGDDIARLDPHLLMATFTAMFDELRAVARDRDVQVESWMTDKTLGGGAPDEDDDEEDDT
jgi:transcriptional regulator with XRE-family HTH domain